ncbi:MAG TPA: SEC-C metal-binding domain-containing protein [Methylocystis sp.]
MEKAARGGRRNGAGDLRPSHARRCRSSRSPLLGGTTQRAHHSGDKIGPWIVTLNEARLADYAPVWSPASTQSQPTKVGRNEPCPCGSGKKYKKCCGLN